MAVLDTPVATSETVTANASTRIDLELIAGLVTPGSRVLDVGCGDGALLSLLEARRQVDGRGVELSQAGVNECVARGLSVIQGDADRDLIHYPDAAFDFVILSQTIQATRNPKTVLTELLRIGERAIVSFPNFGHWSIRLSLGLRGRMPVTRNLTHSWYDTPNIHFCTIRDFVALADEIGAEVELAMAINATGQKMGMKMPWAFWNLFGQQAVFVLRR
ncbi:methionine biosynthesis protein MetW [Aurantimonas sp. C2-6-R+9]|uniref:methionine biosynthesis protein MetW n=1 Tax=unclassified Aurantimonas TaxID=2638230 RepID=UPI002E18703E|nr:MULTISPECIES: methionine biosynthesis protein MetW [unclassified Aurantimonas]MEC5292225.1 methionine biosynthesis protein MetW [Aurantimonas sp. C2-3-R2]MEC5324263.1 methionine biosynthesis protein MetW [Aurantimonas sp. A3-2-R12]MEC5382326.1 methionine biosynthesis protein MetW [Aurantimonas sp. C2-6-R+9]MEC5413277.1 methionine biosynthesis protein MetW [Aurantimonas sp. C2-4-R8]